MNNPILEFLVEALILADSLPKDPAPLLTAALADSRPSLHARAGEPLIIITEPPHQTAACWLPSEPENSRLFS